MLPRPLLVPDGTTRASQPHVKPPNLNCNYAPILYQNMDIDWVRNANETMRRTKYSPQCISIQYTAKQNTTVQCNWFPEDCNLCIPLLTCCDCSWVSPEPINLVSEPQPIKDIEPSCREREKTHTRICMVEERRKNYVLPCVIMCNTH